MKILPPNQLGVKENDQVCPDRADCRLRDGAVFLSGDAGQTLFCQRQQREYSSSGKPFLRRKVMPAGEQSPAFSPGCLDRHRAPFFLCDATFSATLKNRDGLGFFSILII